MKTILFAILLGSTMTLPATEPAFRVWDGNYLSLFELPRDKRAESFDTLLATPVPSKDTAEKLAYEFWIHHPGLLAEESLRVSGLFRAGRAIDGFATQGEWIWEIRVSNLDFGVDGVIWINAHTKKISNLTPKT